MRALPSCYVSAVSCASPSQLVACSAGQRCLTQARAGGGRLPQLYEAKVHLRLRLGMLARLFYLVSTPLTSLMLPVPAAG